MAFEKLQLKHHPPPVFEKPTGQQHNEESDASSPPPSRPTTSASAPGSETRTKSKSLGAASEPVFQDTVKSHQLYDTTLTKWHGFVAENEKRTEAYWIKMLGGKKPRIPSKGGINLFRKAVKDVSTVRRFLSKSTSCPDPELPKAGASYAEWKEEEFSNPTSKNTSLVLTSPSVSSEAYARRLERVKSFHAELDQQARLKLDRDKEYLEEKQRMGKEEMDKKSGKG